MHPRRLPLLLSVATAAALVAACNSASGSATPAAPGVTSGPGATTAATAAGGATGNPQASIDVGQAAQGLANVNSYKVTMQVSGATSVEVVYVKGPPAARSATTTSGSVTTRFVEIGDDVWIDQGTGTFAKNVMPKAQVDTLFAAFDPLLFMRNLQNNPNLQYLQNQGVESKNGVQATHLHADSSTALPPGASPIPAGGSVDLWVAVDGGYLVALEAKGLVTASAAGSGDVSIEVSNVNDPTLTVPTPS
jgi:hypothetical protein